MTEIQHQPDSLISVSEPAALLTYTRDISLKHQWLFFVVENQSCIPISYMSTCYSLARYLLAVDHAHARCANSIYVTFDPGSITSHWGHIRIPHWSLTVLTNCQLKLLFFGGGITWKSKIRARSQQIMRRSALFSWQFLAIYFHRGRKFAEFLCQLGEG